MIHFISDKYNLVHEDITCTDGIQGAALLQKMYESNTELAIDCETNGLDPYQNEILLISIADRTTSIVLARDCFHLLPTNPDDYLWIAHNGIFDFRMFKIQLSYTMVSIWDTMIADQKYYQGALYHPATNKFGPRMRITDTIQRHLKMLPLYMDKESRKRFVGLNAEAYIPTIQDVLYSGTDVAYLCAVKEVQEDKLRKSGILPYMENVGMYIDMATGLTELEGWILNVTQWRQTIEANKKRKFELVKSLDAQVQFLRDTLLTPEERAILSNGKYDRNRVDASVSQMSLFGEPVEIDATKSTAYINWNSTDQITELFAKFKFPLPTDSKREPYAVPQLYTTKDAKGNVKNGIKKDMFSFTTKKDNISTFLLENPDTPGRPILQILEQYRNADHEISSFGQNWIDAIHPVTGKVHTRYRTDTAITGRFQSGEANTIYFNHQNIPRKQHFRTAFGVDNSKYSVSSTDLAGAEVTILCDKAHDLQLYEWAVKEDDAHSPIAQACWRNIYLYRAGCDAGIWKTPKAFWKDYKSQAIHRMLAESSYNQVQKAFDLSQTFTVSKAVNVAFRQTFKNVTFATVYGVHVAKCAKMLGITKDEAYIVLDTIKRAIPDTFAYVEGNVDFVFTHGYLVLDERTGSRVVFPKIIEVLKKGLEANETTMDWRDLHDADGVARNAPIQGTQASMVKESMCEIQMWNYKHRFDAAILNMVHDEINSRQPREYDGVNGDKTVLWLSDKAKGFLAPNQKLVLPVLTYDIPVETTHALIDRGWAAEVSYPEFVKRTMTETANRYLKHFKMGAETQVADTWVK